MVEVCVCVQELGPWKLSCTLTPVAAALVRSTRTHTPCVLEHRRMHSPCSERGSARHVFFVCVCVCVFCALLACVSFLYKCGHLNVTPENNFL